MIRKTLRAILLFALAGVITVVLALLWVLHTETGGTWLLQRVSTASHGAIVFSDVGGTLARDARIGLVRFDSEGLSADIHDLTVTVRPTLFPAGLRVQRLEAARVAVTTKPGRAGSEDADSSPISPLPVTLDIRDAAIGPLEIDGQPVWSGLRLTARVGRRVEIADLQMNTQYGAVGLEATIDLEAPHALDASLAVEIDAGADRPPVRLSALARGDLDHLVFEAQADEPELVVVGDAWGLLSELRYSLRMTADEIRHPHDGAQPILRITGLDATVEGKVDVFNWRVGAEVDALSFQSAKLSMSGTGDADALHADSFAFEDAAHQLAGSWRLGWRPEPNIELDLSLLNLAPGAWITEWTGESLSGGVEATWTPGGLTVGHFELSGQETPMHLAGSGHWNSVDGVVSVDAGWRHLYWPVNTETGSIVSESGHVQVRGRPDEWTAQGSAGLAAGNYPDGFVRFDAGGDMKHARLETLEISALGGTAKGDATIAWHDSGEFETRVELDGIQAGAFLPDLGGSLSGLAAVRGDWRLGSFEINSPGLDANYRGRDVRIDGLAGLDDTGWRFERLRLRSEETEVMVDGAPMTKSASLRVRQLHLQDWLDDVTAEVEADAIVSLNPAGPFFEGSVLVQDASVSSLEAGRVLLEGVIRPGKGGEADLRLRADDLAQDGKPIGGLTVDYTRGGGTGTLSAALSSEAGDLAFVTEGSLAGPFSPGTVHWSGQLDQLHFESSIPGLDSLDLQQARPLRAGAGDLQLDEACLLANEGGTLCVSLSQTGDGPLTVRLGTQDWPLNIVAAALMPGWVFDQTLSGNATLVLRNDVPAQSEGHLTLGQGSIIRSGSAVPMLATGDGLLHWSMPAGRKLEASLDLPLSGLGIVRGKLEIADVTQGMLSSLTGSMELNLSDLAFLSALAPELDRAEGIFHTRLEYSGTLEAPQLAGFVKLSDGVFEYQPLGLRFTDTELEGRFPAGAPAEAKGHFRSGDGVGQIEARLGFDGTVPSSLTLKLKGDDLLLANIPEVRLTATPDIEISWRPGQVVLGGSLTVPFARLTPRESLGDRVTESADVAIVVGSADSAEAAPAAPVNVTGRIDFQLGDDVRLDLAGARMQIGGGLLLNWKPGLVTPMGSGMLTLAGEYKAYGQLLEIREGEITFPGGPADNPQLKLRAVREIFGSREVLQAGVWVNGTAQRPRISLYTNPSTSEEKALSYLLTGSAFDYGNGVGQLSVGTYVLPRLFVSYGRGLFENVSVISGRFDLSRRWGVRASSSERESGADLTFTIDR